MDLTIYFNTLASFSELFCLKTTLRLVSFIHCTLYSWTPDCTFAPWPHFMHTLALRLRLVLFIHQCIKATSLWSFSPSFCSLRSSWSVLLSRFTLVLPSACWVVAAMVASERVGSRSWGRVSWPLCIMATVCDQSVNNKNEITWRLWGRVLWPLFAICELNVNWNGRRFWGRVSWPLCAFRVLKIKWNGTTDLRPSLEIKLCGQGVETYYCGQSVYRTNKWYRSFNVFMRPCVQKIRPRCCYKVLKPN